MIKMNDFFQEIKAPWEPYAEYRWQLSAMYNGSKWSSLDLPINQDSMYITNVTHTNRKLTSRDNLN